MTETRLRTFTHFAGYCLATLFIVSLAAQNLRYGFYELFYLAITLAVLTLLGAAYTVFSRRQQLRAPGHRFMLAILNASVIAALFSLDRADIGYWVMPLLLLNMLILPLRQGLILSGGIILILAGYLLAHQPLADALLIVAAALIILSAAALYIWHYQHMAQSAEDLSITDPVTGAHNARFLDESLQKEISRAKVTGHSLSVIMLGIDYLDEIENLHGTSALQDLFREMTRHLFDVIRAGDTLYALDNGEFFLILPFTPEEGVRVIAERVRRTMAENHWPAARKLTVSLGCTTCNPDDHRSCVVRDRAHRALQEARNRGHDRIWFSQHDDARQGTSG